MNDVKRGVRKKERKKKERLIITMGRYRRKLSNSDRFRAFSPKCCSTEINGTLLSDYFVGSYLHRQLVILIGIPSNAHRCDSASWANRSARNVRSKKGRTEIVPINTARNRDALLTRSE